ncbi:MAG: hypothetical protein IT353_15305, partial [Gemmatimonadaceae bacterium]|nr:hypothetical protein [Gemmatimonadaceae bacterium]
APRDRPFAVWRTYAWDRPTVSFGRNESVRNHYTPASLEAASLDAVRRPTGGRALLHAREVTYSVTMPIGDDVPWQLAYEAINQILVDALCSLGVAAHVVGARANDAIRPDGPICFARPSRGEIEVGGAKLVGSAVWRERGAYLQHGTILLENDQGRLARARDVPIRTDDTVQPAQQPEASMSGVTSLAQCLAHPPNWEAVADALEGALRSQLSHRHAGELSPAAVVVDAGAIERHEVRFRDPHWLWRR